MLSCTFCGDVTYSGLIILNKPCCRECWSELRIEFHNIETREYQKEAEMIISPSGRHYPVDYKGKLV